VKGGLLFFPGPDTGTEAARGGTQYPRLLCGGSPIQNPCVECYIKKERTGSRLQGTRSVLCSSRLLPPLMMVMMMMMMYTMSQVPVLVASQRASPGHARRCHDQRQALGMTEVLGDHGLRLGRLGGDQAAGLEQEIGGLALVVPEHRHVRNHLVPPRGHQRHLLVPRRRELGQHVERAVVGEGEGGGRESVELMAVVSSRGDGAVRDNRLSRRNTR
jgi:hypothetical protein